MRHCYLCDGKGKRFEPVYEMTIERKCTNCDGEGKVPVVPGWRPFENSKEAFARSHQSCLTCLKCVACGWCRCT